MLTPALNPLRGFGLFLRRQGRGRAPDVCHKHRALDWLQGAADDYAYGLLGPLAVCALHWESSQESWRRLQAVRQERSPHAQPSPHRASKVTTPTASLVPAREDSLNSLESIALAMQQTHLATARRRGTTQPGLRLRVSVKRERRPRPSVQGRPACHRYPARPRRAIRDTSRAARRSRRCRRR